METACSEEGLAKVSAIDDKRIIHEGHNMALRHGQNRQIYLSNIQLACIRESHNAIEWLFRVPIASRLLHTISKPARNSQKLVTDPSFLFSALY